MPNPPTRPAGQSGREPPAGDPEGEVLCRLVAGHRADFAGGRYFEDLEIVRGAQFVVLQAARDIDRVAGFAAQRLAGLEFELDPAIEDIDELVLADMVVPAGRLGHAGLGL